MNQGGWDWQDI